MNREREVFVVEAVRSPIGRRGGALAGALPAKLLGDVLTALIDRSGIDPGRVEQVVGGCVSQVGEQAPHIVRYAWLSARLPHQTGATTLDAQCGSGQQSINVVASLIRSGTIDVGIGCGVEMMSRVPLGAAGNGTRNVPMTFPVEIPSQFLGAERIAQLRRLGRDDLDAFGARSQQLAAQAWTEGRFAREVVPVTVPDADGAPTLIAVDGGLRDTTAATLSGLRSTYEGALHTAGTSSQISDGASAVLLASADAVRRHGLEILARVVDHCLVGADPYTYLDGPPDATERLLCRTGLKIDDIDRFEINEAFAAVPLSWLQVTGADPERMNVNGGAIALGHPVGASGARLVTTLVHELVRSETRRGLVAMCCGGAMATGTILERS